MSRDKELEGLTNRSTKFFMGILISVFSIVALAALVLGRTT